MSSGSMIFGNCRGKMGDVVFERSKEREFQRVHLKKHKANFSEKNLAVRARLALCAKAWNYYSKLGITNYTQREFCRKNFPRVSIVPREVYEYNESGCPFIDWQFRDVHSFLPYSDYSVGLIGQGAGAYSGAGYFRLRFTVPFSDLISAADYSYDFRGIQRYVYTPMNLLNYMLFNRLPNRKLEVWGYMLQEVPGPPYPTGWDQPERYMQNGAVVRTTLTDLYVRSYLASLPSGTDTTTIFSKEEGMYQWFGVWIPSGGSIKFLLDADFMQLNGKVGHTWFYCGYYYEGDDETPAFFDFYLDIGNFNPPLETRKSTSYVFGWRTCPLQSNDYVLYRQRQLFEASKRNLDDWLITWASKEELANRNVYSV